jgi:hypothetical protein
MQRPRLTEKTAEALASGTTYLKMHWWCDDTLEEKDSASIKRAIEYLEDLLRWHGNRPSPSDGG